VTSRAGLYDTPFECGGVVHPDGRAINPTGPAVTEFSIQKPEGWPAGDYSGEILFSGTTAAVSKAFKVI